MKLKYTKALPKTHGTMVLIKPPNWRVECHLRGEADQQVCLIALSGADQQVDRCKSLGPFVNLAHAVAARNAIAQSLLEKGYHLSGEPEIWSLVAQREIRQQRNKKQADTSSYKFDPKDVFLDW